MLAHKVLNIPNLLTLFRIVLTPVIVFAVLSQQPKLALGLMVTAGVTDMLDGAIAKHFNQRTTVGAFMDPLADKLMLISCIVTLFLVGQVPLFLFLAVIFRDVIIMGGALAYELVTHRLEMRPSLISKATTMMQIVYVVAVLIQMAFPISALLVLVILWVTFALTCVSGVHYMLAWTLKAVRATEVE